MSEIINSNELCSYGCGNKAKYINKSGNLMCEKSASKCPENKRKNSLGLKKSYENGDRDAKDTYKNMSEESKSKMNWNKENFKADFSYDGKGSHKKVLIKERGHKCESCGLSEWLNEQIPLELEHCDGDNRNNSKDNLLLLCPNCHAKTKYYRGRNKNNGKIKVTDDKILTEIQNGYNIRQILLNVGLTPKGANYERVKKLMSL